jgi:hypothetical protein
MPRNHQNNKSRQNGGTSAAESVQSVVGPYGQHHAAAGSNVIAMNAPTTSLPVIKGGSVPLNVLKPTTLLQPAPYQKGGNKSRRSKKGGDLTNVLVPAVLLLANNYNGYVTKPVNRVMSTVSSVGKRVRSLTRKGGRRGSKKNQKQQNQKQQNQKQQNQNQQ